MGKDDLLWDEDAQQRVACKQVTMVADHSQEILSCAAGKTINQFRAETTLGLT